MNLYYLRSMSPGVRYIISNVFKKIIQHKYNKQLLQSNIDVARRSGKIVCRHCGRRHKRLYRKVNFWRDKIYKFGCVCIIDYDPNRNSHVALVFYKDRTKIYILAPTGIYVGVNIVAGFRVLVETGNSLPLWNIPLGTDLHNVELYPGRGRKLGRSAGTFVSLLAREYGFVTLRLPSGKFCFISQISWATIGQISNVTARSTKKGKAGHTIWLGRRSRVRGSVINPVDHPHGGGEGRRPIGRIHSCTPWGKPRLGQKTRHIKKYSDVFFL